MHDHVGWWGDGREALYGLAAAVLAAGLERGEKMVFIAEGPRRDHRPGRSDLGRLIARGDVEFRDVDREAGPRTRVPDEALDVTPAVPSQRRTAKESLFSW